MSFPWLRQAGSRGVSGHRYTEDAITPQQHQQQRDEEVADTAEQAASTFELLNADHQPLTPMEEAVYLDDRHEHKHD